MKILNKIAHLRGDQRGAALFIVAAAMVSLLGFSALVTDIGLIAANRQKLINTMDAAALAGVMEMPDTVKATTTARDYAAHNKYVQANAGDPQVNISGGRITVSGSKDVNLAFARVFGINSRTVSASASAEIQALTSYLGALPLTIDETSYNNYRAANKEFEIKTDSPSIGSGNFGALSLNTDTDYDPSDRTENGASAYRANLVNGSGQVIKVGDQLLTKPGNMDGPTGKGIRDRVSCSCKIDTYHSHSDCPRIVVVPIFKEVPYVDSINGRTYVTVAGFASVFITKVTGSKIEVFPLSNVFKDGMSSPTQVNYGVIKPVLIK